MSNIKEGRCKPRLHVSVNLLTWSMAAILRDYDLFEFIHVYLCRTSLTALLSSEHWRATADQIPASFEGEFARFQSGNPGHTFNYGIVRECAHIRLLAAPDDPITERAPTPAAGFSF